MLGKLKNLWLLAAFVAFAATTGCASEAGNITVKPAEINDVLLNPGKGWVLYGLPSDQSAETFALGTTGYLRFDWNEIQPGEDRYNWSRIDDVMNSWAKYGKKFAFGVMCANTNSGGEYVTPKWVFDAGAGYTRAGNNDNTSNQYIPVWDNPVFLQKLRDFTAALAKHYDKNPNIAYIDIRSFGNWGEGHLWPFEKTSSYISEEKLKEHISIYRDAFRATQLVLPWGGSRYDPVYQWAVTQKVGIRRDGIMGKMGEGGSDGSECTQAFRHVPSVFEFFGTYQSLVEAGLWSSQKLEEFTQIGKPSYIGMGQWGNDAQVMLSKEQELVKKLANRMGYHFVLKEAILPPVIADGKAAKITLTWLNKGVAPVYEPCKAVLALLDSSGNVKGLCRTEEIKPEAWMPGSPAVENVNFSFSGLSKGSYRLAIGLFRNEDDSSPVYRLGIEGRTQKGWYIISEIKVK